jgi:hypothetical protein
MSNLKNLLSTPTLSDAVEQLKLFTEKDNVKPLARGYPIQQILENLNDMQAQLNQATSTELSESQKKNFSDKLDDMNFPESVRLIQKQQMEELAEFTLQHPEHRQVLLNCINKEDNGLTAENASEMLQDLANRYSANHLEVGIDIEMNYGKSSYYVHKKIDEETSLLSFDVSQAETRTPKYMGQTLGIMAHELNHAYQMKLADDYNIMEPDERLRIEDFIANEYQQTLKQNPKDERLKEADLYISGKLAEVSYSAYRQNKGWNKSPLELNSQIAAEAFSDAVINQLDIQPNLRDRMDHLGGYEYQPKFKEDLQRIAEEIHYSLENPGSLQGLPVKTKNAEGYLNK